MGKAAGQKAKVDAKRAIKEKKKFKNKNSIGKTKKKTGSAGRYVTRTMAVNKLQVTLKDFRKLCILKGIYPREPKKKFKGGNTTYFFAKDVQFLMHEPLLDRFREQKAFVKKITKAAGRHEKQKAKRLESRKPIYKLDHLIRERYPTFVDALQEMDDVLCLVFLFASQSPSQYIPAARVAACSRLRREFLAYVARTRALRKVFVSIKGIYYQADVNGVTLTWVEPHHSFAQQPTMMVDYRVMSSFLELYEAVLTFVNFKLYHDLSLSYPPQIDAKADGAGVHLGAAVLAPKKDVGAKPAEPVAPTANGKDAYSGSSATLSKSQLASLRSKLQNVDPVGDASVSASAEAVADEGADAVDFDAGVDAMVSPEVAALRSLFSKCVFFCGREAPVPSLELIILSCGGRIGWEGDLSPFTVDDARITHHVIDRPHAGEGDGTRRERVQPQWVYDCVNAHTLLPTYPYRPGTKPPPHLSPFEGAGKGEDPKERVRLAVLEATREASEAMAANEDEDEDDEDEDEDDEEEEGEEEDDEEEEGEEEDDEEDEEEAVRYRKELAAERAGVAYEESSAKVTAAKRKRVDGVSSGDEEKALAMMMMTNKKRRLYNRMQYGINQKNEAEEKLQAKRDAIAAKKGGKKKKP